MRKLRAIRRKVRNVITDEVAAARSLVQRVAQALASVARRPLQSSRPKRRTNKVAARRVPGPPTPASSRRRKASGRRQRKAAR